MRFWRKRKLSPPPVLQENTEILPVGLETAAHHLAGHAVMARALDYDVLGLKLQAHVDGWECFLQIRWCGEADSSAGKTDWQAVCKRINREALILLAGPFAEAREQGHNSMRRLGERRDLADVGKHIMCLELARQTQRSLRGEPPIDRPEYYKALYAQVAGVFSAPGAQQRFGETVDWLQRTAQ